MWAMKIQRDGDIRSICKLWKFFVFFLVSLLSDYAVAQTGPAPKAAIPQSGCTINKNMAVVLTVLVCFFFVIGFFSVYTGRCSQQRPIIGDYDFAVVHDPNYNHWRGVARGLDEAILETFPTFCYSAVKEFKNSLDCAVCLNVFEEDDLLRLIPKCSHVFHSGCIDAWLATHSTCPVCRANLLHKPSEINQTLPPLLEHEVRLNESDQGSESNQLERQISIRIAEEPHARDDKAIAPPSRSTEWEIGGVSQRNNSTGQLPEKDERLTLRSLEDVQNHILNSEVGQSRRFPTLPRERCQREGHREVSDEVRRARSRRREYTPESEGLAGKVPSGHANFSQV